MQMSRIGIGAWVTLLATPLASGCEYVAHANTIGPAAQQSKKNEFVCSSSSACISEAATACSNLKAKCSSYGYSTTWNSQKAQLYSTHWNASYSTSGWTLYACAGDAPPAPDPPSPPPPPPPPDPLNPVGACKSNIDCSLNGACDASTGKCNCNPPWMNGPSLKEACNVFDVSNHSNDYIPAYGGPRTNTVHHFSFMNFDSVSRECAAVQCIHASPC